MLPGSGSRRKSFKSGLPDGLDSRLLSAEMTAFRGGADIGQIDGTVLHLHLLFTEKPNAFDVVGFFLPDDRLCFVSAVCEGPDVESEGLIGPESADPCPRHVQLRARVVRGGGRV
jgi:hypothetical protein